MDEKLVGHILRASRLLTIVWEGTVEGEKKREREEQIEEAPG